MVSRKQEVLKIIKKHKKIRIIDIREQTGIHPSQISRYLTEFTKKGLIRRINESDEMASKNTRGYTSYAEYIDTDEEKQFIDEFHSLEKENLSVKRILTEHTWMRTISIVYVLQGIYFTILFYTVNPDLSVFRWRDISDTLYQTVFFLLMVPFGIWLVQTYRFYRAEQRLSTAEKTMVIQVKTLANVFLLAFLYFYPIFSFLELLGSEAASLLQIYEASSVIIPFGSRLLGFLAFWTTGLFLLLFVITLVFLYHDFQHRSLEN